MAKCIAKEELTVSNAATQLALVTNATYANDLPGLTCTIQCDPVNGNAIRFWPDGSAPTTTSGFVLQSGDTMSFDGEIDKLYFIRQGASDGKLNVLYLREV